MDFTTMGSVSSYIKNFGLQVKWEQKKKTNDFQNEEQKTELQRKNEQFKKSYMEQQNDNENDHTLNSIYTKIETGAKLTPDEMKYLQIKNPTVYQKVKNLEAEKKQYEKDLKKCKTKDDVEKLKFSKLSSAMSTLNSVKNNPNIPESAKLQVCTEELRRLKSLEKIANKFIKSGEYRDLPTEAEKNKAEQEIKEAEERERTEAPETVESADNTDNSEKNDVEVTENKDSAESCETEKDTAEIKPDGEVKSIKEAEQTSEAKKLKRSKARSVYKKVFQNNFSEPAVLTPIISKGNKNKAE